MILTEYIVVWGVGFFCGAVFIIAAIELIKKLREKILNDVVERMR